MILGLLGLGLLAYASFRICFDMEGGGAPYAAAALGMLLGPIAGMIPTTTTVIGFALLGVGAREEGGVRVAFCGLGGLIAALPLILAAAPSFLATF